MNQKVQRPIDRHLQEFSGYHQNSTNVVIQYICIPLITFCVLGLVWSIPFPHLNGLGRYNGFVNWASFLIAFAVYYYYRVFPVLSYGVLLLVFVFAAGIVGLEKAQLQSGWPALGQICLLALILTSIVQFFGYKIEGKVPPFAKCLWFLLIGPLWLVQQIYKKVGLKY